MRVAERLIKSAKPVWDKMLSHRFLEEVGRGTISKSAFQTWLVQDYLFVREALRFLGALILKSPQRDISLALVDSLGALKRELSMFEGYAKKMGISLEAEKSRVCRSYTDFLVALALSRSFEEALSALWCAEKAYLDSWMAAKRLANDQNPYLVFIDNWTGDAMQTYVAWLEETLERLAEEKPEREIKAIEETFILTATYELMFWDMAYEEPPR
jgi:thiaminase